MHTEQYHMASMQHTLQFHTTLQTPSMAISCVSYLVCFDDSLGGTFIKRSFTFGGFALSSQSISMHVRTSEEPVALLWRPSNDESATWNEIHASDIKTIDGKGKSRHLTLSLHEAASHSDASFHRDCVVRWQDDRDHVEDGRHLNGGGCSRRAITRLLGTC